MCRNVDAIDATVTVFVHSEIADLYLDSPATPTYV